LLASKVLCVGGRLVLPHHVLAGRRGLGTIGIAEGDVVDDSNLQRQIIHSPRSGAAPNAIGQEEDRQINPTSR